MSSSVQCSPQFINEFTNDIAASLDFGLNASETKRVVESAFLTLVNANVELAMNSETMSNLSKAELTATAIAEATHWFLRWSWGWEFPSHRSWTLKDLMEEEEDKMLIHGSKIVWKSRLSLKGPEFYIKSTKETTPGKTELLGGTTFWEDNPAVLIMDIELYYLGKVEPKPCPVCKSPIDPVPHPLTGYSIPERHYTSIGAGGTTMGSNSGVGAIIVGCILNCSRPGCRGQVKTYNRKSSVFKL